jgi:predicted Zn-dependent protease
MRRTKRAIVKVLAAAAAFSVASCASTGGPFGISEEQGRALGEREHPKIVAAFGGEMNHPELFAYVDGITKKLMAVSENPAEPVKVTLLDSPVINAMALPGHVYVTRGLLALGNSEAELAGVIGHELGHIYKRHTARRISRGNMATLGSVLVGILTRNPGLMQTAGQAAQLYLLQFSREQEYESDLVGVRLLAAAGYDPAGAAEFLDSLDRYSKLESQIAGSQAAPPEFLSTHPNTAERVRRAAAEAQAVPRSAAMTAQNSRAQYLSKIDGVLYGDDPVKQGFIRGSEFIHPEMRISFSAPSGFKLQNTSTAVIATAQNAQMQFTGANSADSPAAIIQGPLAQQLGVQFSNIRQFSVGGRQGAAGYGRAQTQNGQVVDVQPFVIKWAGDTNYLFLWVSAQDATRSLQNGIEQSVASLREINPASINAPPTQRIDVVAVRSGDTVASLAQRSAFENYKRERFCVLNGLDTCASVAVGEQVKLVR